ncbi:MAG: type I restriction enzyme M protein [Lentisphaeria bacterium]|jgi:type I restriction enzyme M protein
MISRDYWSISAQGEATFALWFGGIKENDYNLNIPRYVDTFEEDEEIDLMAVRKALKSELAELEQQMDGYLVELGYRD